MAWAISGPTVGGPQWLDVHAVSGPPDVALCGPIVAELLASWGANGGWLSGSLLFGWYPVLLVKLGTIRTPKNSHIRALSRCTK